MRETGLCDFLDKNIILLWIIFTPFLKGFIILPPANIKSSICFTYNKKKFGICLSCCFYSFLIKSYLTFWRIADRLPYSIRILLESAIRNCDNFQVTVDDVEKIIDWENTSPKQVEIPFKPARVLLQVHRMIFVIV